MIIITIACGHHVVEINNTVKISSDLGVAKESNNDHDYEPMNTKKSDHIAGTSIHFQLQASISPTRKV